MTPSAPEPLGDHHILDNFDSGIISLDDWLKRRARTNQASGASRTFFVAAERSVIAYYALASSSVAHADAIGGFRRNMPDPVPVVTLGRLAVDRRYQSRGYGRGLIRDAARRVAVAADQIGIRGLIVHAINEEARLYYLKRGFLPSPTNEMTLMISLNLLRDSL